VRRTDLPSVGSNGQYYTSSDQYYSNNTNSYNNSYTGSYTRGARVLSAGSGGTGVRPTRRHLLTTNRFAIPQDAFAG